MHQSQRCNLVRGMHIHSPRLKTKMIKKALSKHFPHCILLCTRSNAFNPINV